MLNYFHKGLAKLINTQGTAEKTKVLTSNVTCKSYKKYKMLTTREAQIRMGFYLWIILFSLFSLYMFMCILKDLKSTVAGVLRTTNTYL